MMKVLLLWIVLACAVSLLTPDPVISAAASGQSERSRLPITVKSNEMTADNKGKTALFIGKVVAKQGDITIYSDKLVVNYADRKNEVEKIEALGSVRIVQQNRTGFADQAVYDNRKGLVVLTGTPRVVQGGDSISGKVITYFVDEEKSEVSSGGDPKTRVEAVINPAGRKSDAGGR